MSRKQRAPKYTVWSAVDTTTAPTSTPTGVKNLDTVLYDITVAAAVNALLTVQGSTDPDGTPDAARTFETLDFGSTLPLVGASDTKYQVLVRDNPFTFMRLVLANNGGTGNITATVSGVSKGA